LGTGAPTISRLFAGRRWPAFTLLPLAGACLAIALLQIGATDDLTYYFIPWLNAVEAGGASSLSGEFSMYTPPYIYLLYLVSGLAPVVGAVAAIKLINLPFVAALAAGVGLIVSGVSGRREPGLLAACVLCVTPTVLVNAFAWGQSDAIYTCFLMFCVYSAMSGKATLAALMFGLALAFKLQAIFLAPFVIYLLLTRQMRMRHAVLIPAAYLLMMVPAALAGRSWRSLLAIYYGQANDGRDLSYFAPNPWRFVEALHLIPYEAGVIAGTLLGALAALAIVVLGLRMPRGHRATLLVATLSAACIPYVLPKMHDRYFFIADVLTLALAFAWPRYWVAAVLFQLGSLAAYLQYFGLSPIGPDLGVVPITLGILALFSAARNLLRRSTEPG
jgi:Gpi18-like mannosyltransferase